MTAPANEKAAPIPAEGPRGADVQRLADRCAQAVYSAIGRRDITRPIKEAIVDAILADRASQQERIREDERGLRGKIVYPCARFRNDNEFRDPNGYVIVKAGRAAASEGRPEPKYYTLVSDTGDVRTLLSTLFTLDPDRARLRGDAS